MNIDWKKNILLPVIAQDYESNKVLMLAYMNEEAYNLTIKHKYAYYFSRSKQRIWKKGETSGHTQIIKDILIDCDSDTLLLKIKQNGVACHKGFYSCFSHSLLDEKEIEVKKIDTEKIYNIFDRLYHIILDRKNNSTEDKSWSKKLLNNPKLLLSKIKEEADELSFAIEKESDKKVIYEASDIFYHIIVGLAYRDISPDRVEQELAKRFSFSGIQEKKRR